MNTKHYLNFLCLGLITLTLGCSSDDNNYLIPVEEPSIENDKIAPLIPATGLYIVNEGWMGPDRGSINGIDTNFNVSYRLFQTVNPNVELGVTTQYATAYGEHYFFVSKKTSRLTMTDKQFKHQATIDDVGGDANAFVGITPTKGYVSTQNGISIISMDGKDVRYEGKIDGFTKQVGTMVYKNNLVYAATTANGLLIIDTQTDEILLTSTDKVNQLTIDRLGNVWMGTDNTLTKLDTSLPIDQQLSLATTYDISPSKIASSAGAWNAGSLSASSQQDILYWKSGKNIAKFDTQTGTVNADFYTLGTDADNVKLEFYGAGLRVDPVKDNLVLTVKRENFGINGSYNWVQFISNTGDMTNEVFIAGGTQNDMDGHYWFPALPLFQDNNAPQIIANQILVSAGVTKEIHLTDIIFDQDNPQELIETSVENIDSTFGEIKIENNILKITAATKDATTTIKLVANSNGKLSEKTVRIRSSK